MADTIGRRIHDDAGLPASGSRRGWAVGSGLAGAVGVVTAIALSAVVGRTAAWAVAAAVVTVGLLMTWLFVDSAGSRRRRSAEFAEQRTSDAVAQLEPDGWVLVDNVEFDGLDVDHVAIGPGGIVVLETKWIDDGLFTASGTLSRYGCEALEQAQRHTERIRSVVVDGGTDPTAVRTFVVVWGTAVPGGRFDSSQPTGSLIDGRLLGELLTSLDIGFTTSDVERARQSLVEFVDARAIRNAAVAEAARRSS